MAGRLHNLRQCGLVLLLLAVAPAARAEKNQEERLSYSATAACPGRASLESQLHKTRALPFHSSVERVKVQLESVSDGYTGRLLVSLRPSSSERSRLQDSSLSGAKLEGARASWTRRLRASSCEDVVAALVTSLSVFMDAWRQDLGEESSPAPLKQDLGFDELQRAQEHEFTDDPSNVELNPEFPFRSDGSPNGSNPRRLTWGLAPGVGWGFRTGVTGGPTGSWELGLDVRGMGDGWDAGRFGVSWALAAGSGDRPVGAGQAGAASLSTPSETWDYEWTAAAAHACPYGFALASWVHAVPCLSAYFGNYTADERASQTLVEPLTQRDWLSFWELNMQLYVRRSIFVMRAHLGVTGPLNLGRAHTVVGPDFGLAFGFGVSIMPDAWIFL